MEVRNNNGLKVIAGLLAVVLVAVIIYAVNLYNNKKETQKILENEKALVLEELNGLRSEYDQLIENSEITNANLVEARSRIDIYRDSVKNMKADLSVLARFRRELSRLKDERRYLLAQNDSLKRSNSLLTMERDSTFRELNRQSSFSDSLVVQNVQLAQAVEKGSELNLAAFNVDAVKERSSGKLVSTSRARRADKLKVCFTVAQNTIAKSGEREFYIEVLDPMGNSFGEGNSASNKDGQSIIYARKSSFFYENVPLDVCDYVNKPSEEFAKGNYMVNVYDDNLRLLSTSRFKLK